MLSLEAQNVWVLKHLLILGMEPQGTYVTLITDFPLITLMHKLW